MAAALPIARQHASLPHDERQRLSRTLLHEARAEADPDRRRDLLGQVVDINYRIAVAVARRYAGRGIATEDLQQAACEGLVKAVHRFDPTRDQDLLDYAVPTMRGEVMRYFRDHGWSVKPPRRIQELQQRLRRTSEGFCVTTGREPSDDELATALGVTRAEYDEAAAARGCFQPTSLDQPLEPGSEACIGDLLPSTDSGEHDAVEARVLLSPALSRLPARERRILYLRYVEERTQGEIGQELGVTQATVSRWLQETLAWLRGQLEPVVA